MDAIALYRTYAASASRSADEAKCLDEKKRLRIIAQGWLDVATVVSVILGGASVVTAPVL
jgi:hypothetical protein